ncbi:MAG: Ig-like domain-containing protein [Clostridia bacterium]|jgi:hypothetical protein
MKILFKRFKAVSVVTLLIFLISQLAVFNVFAADKAAFTVDSAEALAGQQVTVSVNVNSITNWGAGGLDLFYDTEKLDCLPSDCVKGVDFLSQSPVISLNTTIGRVRFAYANADGFTGSGKIFTVKFTVKADAAGSALLHLVAGEIVDTTFDPEPQPIENTVADGSITVTEGVTPTPTPIPVTDTPTPSPTSITPTPTPISVSSVKVSKTAVTLKVAQTLQLTVTVSPSNAANKSVKWTTSSYKVATVSSTGRITAKAKGIATITVTTVSGAKKATCRVTVVQPVKSVKLNKTTLTLKKGETYKLAATVSPLNASNKKVTWKSGNKRLATIGTTGIVKAKVKGTVYIYVTTVDGKKTARCKVIIK